MSHAMYTLGFYQPVLQPSGQGADLMTWADECQSRYDHKGSQEAIRHKQHYVRRRFIRDSKLRP